MNIILGYISLLSGLLPICCGLYRLSSRDKELRILLLFFIFAFLADCSALLLFKSQKNNLWLENVFHLLECIVYCKVFESWFSSAKIGKMINGVLVLWVIFWGVTTFFICKSIFEFNVYTHCGEGLILLFFSALLLHRISAEADHSIWSEPKFWICSSLLLFFSINTIISSLAGFIFDESVNSILQIWMIRSLTSIFANILFSIGFLCNLKRSS